MVSYFCLSFSLIPSSQQRHVPENRRNSNFLLRTLQNISNHISLSLSLLFKGVGSSTRRSWRTLNLGSPSSYLHLQLFSIFAFPLLSRNATVAMSVRFHLPSCRYVDRTVCHIRKESLCASFPLTVRSRRRRRVVEYRNFG